MAKNLFCIKKAVILNQQKFSFEHIGVKNNCHQIRAKKGFSMIGYTKMDLGIAKYHFEIGAGKVNFEWVYKNIRQLNRNL